MKKLNGQQIYDKVKIHLLKQMQHSTRDCVHMYRGPHGLKCAAGVLISDVYYTRALEGNIVNVGSDAYCGCGLVTQALVESGVDPQWMSLVRDMQKVHDGYAPGSWKAVLAIVSKSYGLKP